MPDQTHVSPIGLRPRDELHISQTPRLVLYVQNGAYVNGEPLSLLPLLEENTLVTHIIVASFHINRTPGDITLNDDPPNSTKYDNLVRITPNFPTLCPAYII
jgi:hypothetical protein